MTTYYRIIHSKHESNPLGFGNSGGRWNSKGTEVIYCANSISLAHTEWLIIKGPAIVKSSWILVKIQIRTKPYSILVDDLPDHWFQRPAIRATKKIGDLWAKDNISLALKIPSARIPLMAFPKEHNLILNPNHPKFHKKVSILEITELKFNIDEWA